MPIMLDRRDILNIPTKHGLGTPLSPKLWCLSRHYIPIPKDCPGLGEAVAACDDLRSRYPSVFWCVRAKEECEDDADYVANSIYALKHFGRYAGGRYSGAAGIRCALQILRILEESYADANSEKNS